MRPPHSFMARKDPSNSCEASLVATITIGGDRHHYHDRPLDLIRVVVVTVVIVVTVLVYCLTRQNVNITVWTERHAQDERHR